MIRRVKRWFCRRWGHVWEPDGASEAGVLRGIDETCRRCGAASTWLQVPE